MSTGDKGQFLGNHTSPDVPHSYWVWAALVALSTLQAGRKRLTSTAKPAKAIQTFVPELNRVPSAHNATETNGPRAKYTEGKSVLNGEHKNCF